MANLSRSTNQYRDGVFSAASPAPRYGQLLTVFENGSLGSLEEDAATDLDAALGRVIQSLQPAGLETRALPPAARASAAAAVALAQHARGESDVNQKLTTAIAASYAATFFGLPRNDLAYVIDQVFGMFAMTSAQRREYHQQAARVLDKYVASLTKGNAMSGVFRDGVLGGAYKDGSLGALMYQNHAFRDGSLGRVPAWRRKRKLSGLGGGCGCSGVGADDTAVATVEPIYKKPLFIGGAAIALGVVLYAVTRK